MCCPFSNPSGHVYGRTEGLEEIVHPVLLSQFRVWLGWVLLLGRLLITLNEYWTGYLTKGWLESRYMALWQSTTTDSGADSHIIMYV